MGTRANPFSGEKVEGALSRADALSRERGSVLAKLLPHWQATIEGLYEESCPKTYVGVLAIALVARMLSATVDVKKIQKRGDPIGYSAAGIGTKIIPFATSQRISLRSTSTQIMNNQPFTFKREITADLTDHHSYPEFYRAVEEVQQLTPDVAEEVLALIFAHGRRAWDDGAGVPLRLEREDWATLEHVLAAIADFVESNPEGGKSGQALAAAILDCVFEPDQVQMKKIHDPSVSSPGDVTVGVPPWISVEAKQVPVTTSHVEAFLDACLDKGIQRARYLALNNYRYPRNIDTDRLARLYGERMSFEVSLSAADALNAVRSFATGPPGTQATHLARALLSRLQQIGFPPSGVEALTALLGELGFVALPEE